MPWSMTTCTTSSIATPRLLGHSSPESELMTSVADFRTVILFGGAVNPLVLIHSCHSFALFRLVRGQEEPKRGRQARRQEVAQKATASIPGTSPPGVPPDDGPRAAQRTRTPRTEQPVATTRDGRRG